MWPELVSTRMATVRSVHVLAVYAFTLISGLSAQIHNMIEDVENKLEPASDSQNNVIDVVLFSNLLRNYTFFEPPPVVTNWGVDGAIDYGYDDLSASSSQEGSPEEEYPYETHASKPNMKKGYGNRDKRGAARFLNLRNKYDDPKVTAEYYDKKGENDE